MKLSAHQYSHVFEIDGGSVTSSKADAIQSLVFISFHSLFGFTAAFVFFFFLFVRISESCELMTPAMAEVGLHN